MSKNFSVPYCKIIAAAPPNKGLRTYLIKLLGSNLVSKELGILLKQDILPPRVLGAGG